MRPARWPANVVVASDPGSAAIASAAGADDVAAPPEGAVQATGTATVRATATTAVPNFVSAPLNRVGRATSRSR